MPDSKRWHYKRVFDQAINDLERAQENMAQLALDYNEHHPEISIIVKQCFDATDLIKVPLVKLRNEI